MAIGVASVGTSPPHRGSIATRRKVMNRLWWGVCGFSLVAVIVPVVWIIAGISTRAAAVWRWNIFVHTSATQNGLLNAITGTFLITAGVAVIAGVVGIGCGVYISEVARPSVMTTILRSASEILSGIPSIVFGYVGYVALVVYFHWGFSLLAAWLVLSFLVVPYVAKSTELALSQVPISYREGGEALGMHRTHVLRRLVFRSAIPGISTGLILALAISIGETAPLLYTANWSDHLPTMQLLHASVPYLTYATYTFYDQPLPSLQALAADASLLLLVMVLLLILAARLIVGVTQKYHPNRAMTKDSRRKLKRAARRAGAYDATAALAGHAKLPPEMK
jgi:phosphate transport system permease protein